MLSSSLLPGPLVYQMFIFFFSPVNREDYPGHGGQHQLPAEKMDLAEGDSAQQFQTRGNHGEHREADDVSRQLPGGPFSAFHKCSLCQIFVLLIWEIYVAFVEQVGQKCSAFLSTFSLIGETCLRTENRGP